MEAHRSIKSMKDHTVKLSAVYSPLFLNLFGARTPCAIMKFSGFYNGRRKRSVMLGFKRNAFVTYVLNGCDKTSLKSSAVVEFVLFHNRTNLK